MQNLSGEVCVEPQQLFRPPLNLKGSINGHSKVYVIRRGWIKPIQLDDTQTRCCRRTTNYHIPSVKYSFFISYTATIKLYKLMNKNRSFTIFISTYLDFPFVQRVQWGNQGHSMPGFKIVMSQSIRSVMFSLSVAKDVLKFIPPMICT